MKNIIYMFFMCFFVFVSISFADCLDIMQTSGNFDSAEYLFIDKNEYEKAKKGSFSRKYICKPSSCAQNEPVGLKAGHVFMGQEVNADKIYKCVWVGLSSGKWEPIVQTNKPTDIKVSNEPASASDDVSNGDKVINVSETALDRCIRSRSSREGKACCYVSEKVATWNGKNCVCIDNTKDFDVDSKQCVSIRNLMSISGKVVDETGAGIPGANVVPLDQNGNWIENTGTSTNSEGGFVYDFPEGTRQIRISYVGYETVVIDVNNIHSPIVMKVKTEVLESVTVRPCSDNETLDQLHAKEADFIDGRCVPTVCKDGYRKQGQVCVENNKSVAIKKIEELSLRLRTLTSGLEQSKWKTEDGKFNSARLGVDLGVGAAVGAVGGVVTNVLMKKGQAKNGFEDISCTVGGEKVADWGDEFILGM